MPPVAIFLAAAVIPADPFVVMLSIRTVLPVLTGPKYHEETNMTPIKHILLAFGTVLLTLAAGTANAQYYGNAPGCNASCEATCQGCAGPACPNGYPCGFPGLQPEDFCHNPGCQYADGAGFVEADPVFSAFGPEFADLCDRCAGCTWRVDASAIYLHRGAPTSLPLLTDPTTGASLLSGNTMEFFPKVGPRIQFVVTDCAGLGLELNYFAVDGWSVTRAFNNAQFPSGVANLMVDSVITEPLDDAQFDLTSVMRSSEINLRQRLFGNVDFLTGFRWLDLNDRYSASGTSAVTGNVLNETIINWNHLFGWQIGLDGRLGPADGKWSIGGFVKVGGALNDANSSVALNDPGNLGFLSTGANECHVAYFSEAGLTGAIQIDKHISVTFGYQVMYINNLAQPLNQIGQTDLTAGTTPVNLNSGVLYHGGNVGMEVAW